MVIPIAFFKYQDKAIMHIKWPRTLEVYFILCSLVARSCLGNHVSSSNSIVSTSQRELDYISESVSVKFNVISNFDRSTPEIFTCTIELTNSGTSTIIPRTWTIYFNFFHIVTSVINSSDTLEVTLIKGMFHSLSPKNIAEWRPQASLHVTIVAKMWLISRSDVIPNWYVTAPGLEPRLLLSTVGETLAFVSPFDTEAKWKRHTEDVYDPPTPLERYRMHYATHLIDARDAKWRIIPTPLIMRMGSRPTVDLSGANWHILVLPKDAILLRAAELLREKTNLVVTRESAFHNVIQITVGKPILPKDLSYVTSEAYHLNVDRSKAKVTITSSSLQGAFNGVQSLLSLADRTFLVPDCDVTDAPRFPYRGLHLDVSRNFRSVEEVTSLIDLMAMYKLNKFHIHLSDDEAWRIEIPDFPELTEIGGKRCHDLTETKCILPFLGSNPTPSLPGSGFYTAAQYQTILKYAKSRGVEVIPEIDVPGHAHAIIKAMQARYKKRTKNSKTAAKDEGSNYIVWDPDDTSEYITNQHYDDDAMNPCIESTYKFLDVIIKTMVEIHKSIQPLRIFHFGGDEVGFGAWLGSPLCSEFLEKNKQYIDVKGLKKYFAKRVAEIGNRYGVTVAAWEDGLKGEKAFERAELSSNDVTGYAWNNVWEWGGGGRAYEMANGGYKVVMSSATHLYFDHPYSPDPEERGLYWATRYINTFKAFSFMPLSIYEHIERYVNGKAILKPEDVCQDDMKGCPSLKIKENIIGMEGHLWSELLRSQEHVLKAAFPRVLALAERAWHEASWEVLMDKASRMTEQSRDWGKFASTVGYKELVRLDMRGVRYHLSPPGAKIDDGRLFANTPFPGLPIEYSEDAGKHWLPANNRPIMTPVTNSNRIILRSRSTDGTQTSAWVHLDSRGMYPTVPPTTHQSSLISIILLSVVLCISFAVVKLLVKKRWALWALFIGSCCKIFYKKMR